MGSDASWTVLDRKIVLADPRLRVRSDLCLTPQGEMVGPTHVIEYPDQVTIVALIPSHAKVVLVRRYRHGVGSIVTGLVSGAVEPVPGTPPPDRAEIAIQRAHRKAARRAGKGAPPTIRPRRQNDVAAQAAAEQAARRELLEQTGYASAEWICLSKHHAHSAHQSNAGFCFLATALDPARSAMPTGEPAEIVEHDFLMALRLMQQGCLTMDGLHAAALWSAGRHIAADHTGRFGPLSTRVRRFFVGEDNASDDEPFMPSAFPASAVGG